MAVDLGRVKIYTGFIIICVLWGSSWAAVKLGLETVPPLLSLGIRFAIASMILAAIVLIRRLALPKSSKFWQLVLIICAASFTIPFILVYWAQIRLSSGLASVLFSTFPFWVALLSHFILPDEKITLSRMLGMVLGFIGVIIIFNDSLSDVSVNTLLGMIAIVLSAIIQAFGLVALRKYGKDIDPVVLNFWPMLFSMSLLLMASIATEDYSNIIFDYKAVGSLIYLSIFCTVITFLIYFWLVKHVEAVILSLSALITPVIAVIIAVLLMSEIFTAKMYIGSSLVLVGVALATISDFVVLHYRKS